MIRQILLAGLMALIWTSGAQAQATCSCNGSDQLKGADLGTALTGNTVCVRNASGWENQELHQSGGKLIDYKKGTDPVDPTSEVGSWAVSGNGADAQVNHTYGASTYSYYVCKPAGSSVIGFCSVSGGKGTTTISGTLKIGSGPCP